MEFTGIKVWTVCSFILILVSQAAMSSLSFLTPVIRVFSLCFSSSVQPETCQFYSSFQTLGFGLIHFLFSIWMLPAPSLYPLLLFWVEFTLFFFLNFFFLSRRFSITDVRASSLGKHLGLGVFLLKHRLLMPHRLLIYLFTFSFASKYFLSVLVVSSWTPESLKSVMFTSGMFREVPGSFCYWLPA